MIAKSIVTMVATMAVTLSQIWNLILRCSSSSFSMPFFFLFPKWLALLPVGFNQFVLFDYVFIILRNCVFFNSFISQNTNYFQNFSRSFCFSTLKCCGAKIGVEVILLPEMRKISYIEHEQNVNNFCVLKNVCSIRVKLPICRKTLILLDFLTFQRKGCKVSCEISYMIPNKVFVRNLYQRLEIRYI